MPKKVERGIDVTREEEKGLVHREVENAEKERESSCSNANKRGKSGFGSLKKSVAHLTCLTPSLVPVFYTLVDTPYWTESCSTLRNWRATS